MLKRFLFFICLALCLNSDHAEARKRKKYKGPIIVNQILRLSGTMMNNGSPTTEFAGIKEGDVLETGPNSAAVFRIPGLGIYRIGENTKLKLAKFAGRDITKFELLNGDLLCIYKRLGSHEVKSENSLISPNGNSQSNIFWLTDLDKKTAITLWDGRVLIKAKNVKEPPSVTPPISQAQIAASDVPVDSKQDPPKPETAPGSIIIPAGFVTELVANTKDSMKKFVVTADAGVMEKEESDVTPPDSRFIKELESLYALP